MKKRICAPAPEFLAPGAPIMIARDHDLYARAMDPDFAAIDLIQRRLFDMHVAPIYEHLDASGPSIPHAPRFEDDPDGQMMAWILAQKIS